MHSAADTMRGAADIMAEWAKPTFSLKPKGGPFGYTKVKDDPEDNPDKMKM